MRTQYPKGYFLKDRDTGVRSVSKKKPYSRCKVSKNNCEKAHNLTRSKSPPLPVAMGHPEGSTTTGMESHKRDREDDLDRTDAPSSKEIKTSEDGLESSIEMEVPQESAPSDSKLVLYSSHHKGPYWVFIESLNKNVQRLHCMSLAKKLKDLNISNYTEIKESGHNRIQLRFNTYQEANRVVKDYNLGQIQLKAFIPSYQVMTQGVIKNVGLELTDEDLQELIIVPEEFKLFQVRRMVKKEQGQLKPLPVVVLSFAGATLPERVQILGLSRKVELYIPKVIQCFQCLRFGHIKEHCKSKIRCTKCGAEHAEEACQPQGEIKCALCGGKHKGNDRRCEKFKQEKQIKEIMAVKKLPFSAAKEALKKEGPVLSKQREKAFEYRDLDFPQLSKDEPLLPSQQIKPSSSKNDTRRQPVKEVPRMNKDSFFNFTESKNLSQNLYQGAAAMRGPPDQGAGHPNKFLEWGTNLFYKIYDYIQKSDSFFLKLISKPAETLVELVMFCVTQNTSRNGQ